MCTNGIRACVGGWCTHSSYVWMASFYKNVPTSKRLVCEQSVCFFSQFIQEKKNIYYSFCRLFRFNLKIYYICKFFTTVYQIDTHTFILCSNTYTGHILMQVQFFHYHAQLFFFYILAPPNGHFFLCFSLNIHACVNIYK